MLPFYHTTPRWSDNRFMHVSLGLLRALRDWRFENQWAPRDEIVRREDGGASWIMEMRCVCTVAETNIRWIIDHRAFDASVDEEIDPMIHPGAFDTLQWRIGETVAHMCSWATVPDDIAYAGAIKQIYATWFGLAVNFPIHPPINLALSVCATAEEYDPRLWPWVENVQGALLIVNEDPDSDVEPY